MKFKTIYSIVKANLGIWYYKITNQHKKILPYKVLLNLTDLCNSRCTYCEIWKIKPQNEINLNNIVTLRKKFNLPIGFSDHSKGISASICSVALGGCVIEKHFTLDKKMKGWDHKISADLNDLTQIIENSKRITLMLGSKKRNISKKENIFKKNMRRSIVAKKLILKDQKIKISDLEFKRPGIGLEPSKLKFVLNKKAKKNIFPDDIILPKNLK